MRTILFLILIFLLISCKKAQVLPYNGEVTNIPWADTSRNHPKNDAFLALLKKYQKKGLLPIPLKEGKTHTGKYSTGTILYLKYIRLLKENGLNLNEMKELMIKDGYIHHDTRNEI